MTDLTADELQLLERVPPDGAPVGNGSLRARLGWDEPKYWAVRGPLLDRGVLETGRGRGGSVRRVPAEPAVPAADVPEPPAVRRRERELYKPIAGVLASRWLAEHRYGKWTGGRENREPIVQITAMQGRRRTGGKWSRPDIAVAALSTYPYVPGPFFDVVTFEVKPADAVNVTAVYEALAHLRSATRAYVMLEVADSDPDPVPDWVTEIVDTASRHGIGVVLFTDPADFATWNEVVEAERSGPDPERLNDFIDTQFTDDQKRTIRGWFKPA